MLKWLFGRNNKDIKAQDGCALTTLYEGDRGIAQLHENDAVIRLWMSEPLRKAMDQTCDEINGSASWYLREFLVVYLYGIHELLKMRAFSSGLNYEPPPQPKADSGIRFSRTSMGEVIPGLGKNLVPCKLKLPSKMKVDLQQLADQRDIPLGRFIREILVQHFLGYTVWPDCFTPIPEEQKIADEWVDGLIESISITSDEVNTKIDTPVKSFS
jgi:hypothetical protein